MNKKKQQPKTKHFCALFTYITQNNPKTYSLIIKRKNNYTVRYIAKMLNGHGLGV